MRLAAPDTVLDTFLARWHGSVRHDLAGSECETLVLPDLLAMAGPEDISRWKGLRLGYTDPHGSDWLRETITLGYRHANAENVLCFAGAQEALSCVLRALLAPGDHAILVLPCYSPTEFALTCLCDVTGVALDADNGWALDIDRVRDAIRPATRLVLVNFPNNPTGKRIDFSAFAALIDLCRERGLWLVNDEVYRLIDHAPEQRLPPVVDAFERGISVDAVSKSLGLPGLRVGWIACRDRAVLSRAFQAKHLASGSLAGPSEILANIAIRAADKILARNQAIAGDNLCQLRNFFADFSETFDWHEPEAGVVAFARYRGAEGVEAWADALIGRAGILVLPASVFRSALAPSATDRFRIGFGKRSFADGLDALRKSLFKDITPNRTTAAPPCATSR